MQLQNHALPLQYSLFSVQACPYFSTRTLKDEATIIFCPYNYLIDPLIREQVWCMHHVHNYTVLLQGTDMYTCILSMTYFKGTARALLVILRSRDPRDGRKGAVKCGDCSPKNHHRVRQNNTLCGDPMQARDPKLRVYPVLKYYTTLYIACGFAIKGHNALISQVSMRATVDRSHTSW